MIEVMVASVGLRGPGLDGWRASVPVLAGEQKYVESESHISAPAFLSSRDRRRCGNSARLALDVALEAVNDTEIPAHDLAPVFGTANGDGDVVHSLLEALSRPNKVISPTMFHNSVHNAAVGYWSIGMSSRRTSTCIAAHDITFGATLIKALTHVDFENEPVLLVVYDTPFPEPLNTARPMSRHPFGVALVLVPVEPNSALPKIRYVRMGETSDAVTPPSQSGLSTIWGGNPAARAIPLLEVLATNRRQTVSLHYHEAARLELDVGR